MILILFLLSISLYASLFYHLYIYFNSLKLLFKHTYSLAFLYTLNTFFFSYLTISPTLSISKQSQFILSLSYNLCYSYKLLLYSFLIYLTYTFIHLHHTSTLAYSFKLIPFQFKLFYLVIHNQGHTASQQFYIIFFLSLMPSFYHMTPSYFFFTSFSHI